MLTALRRWLTRRPSAELPLPLTPDQELTAVLEMIATAERRHVDELIALHARRLLLQGRQRRTNGDGKPSFGEPGAAPSAEGARPQGAT